MNLLRAARLAPYLLDRKQRLRVFGARVEVCAFLSARTPQPAILLVKSQYGPWMPLQEGVGANESLEAALWRGLREEVGLDFETEERGRLVNDQGCRFLGTRRLPKERWDRNTRAVAPGLPDGHPLTLIKVRKKAYWGLFRQVSDFDQHALSPNGTEVIEAEWLPLAEARERVRQTVPVDKLEILSPGFDICEQALSGTALHFPEL
jgi:ADP-ribose pyrophosphatase YjhB (NUDIX family)